MKSVRIRSFFWSVFSRIRAECGEILRIKRFKDRILEVLSVFFKTKDQCMYYLENLLSLL